MRNYSEVHMLNMIERHEQYVPPVVNPVVLTEGDKAGIQSYRNRVERAHSKRVPIFDRTRVNANTLGHMAYVVALKEAAKFSGFGAMIAAELQKAGM